MIRDVFYFDELTLSFTNSPDCPHGEDIIVCGSSYNSRVNRDETKVSLTVDSHTPRIFLSNVLEESAS